MDLIVEGRSGAIEGRAMLGERSYVCRLGRSGIARDKREGDGATPVGRFPLRQVFYRPDRGPAPQTSVPHRALTEADGWCDEPTSPDYNRGVTLPFAASHEEMWRTDSLYDLVVVIGHNDSPVVPHMGSAVFLHVASPDGDPTAGCVAFNKADLLEILSRLTPADHVSIRLDETAPAAG
ncbi:MAG TPA: L,D-transpeptidase family protein [Terriglobales bacterium]|nr:L,D-transpeptidase family protein [Terriglobales bacterium]